MTTIPRKAPQILIAEDSATQRAQLQHLLERENYEVVIAINGKEALTIARRCKPMLIISDIVMPELDGYGLCAAVKSDPQLKDVPVILLTTLADPHDVLRALECGADNFVNKPYENAYLLSRIKYMLMSVEMRRGQKMQAGVELTLDSQRYFITTERQQVLDMLISTYEQAVAINLELKAREMDLQHSNRTLVTMIGIADKLNKATGMLSLAEVALRRVEGLPGVRAGWISVVEDGKFRTLATTTHLPLTLEEPGVMEGLCVCQRKQLAGELESVTNVLDCERLQGAGNDTRGRICHGSIPLRVGDETIGMLNLVASKTGALSDQDARIMDMLGGQLGVALSRARLHDDLERVVQERTTTLTAEIEQRKRAEEEARAVHAELEQRVLSRTAEVVQAREEAEAANRAKSAFLATMSHEIRTPMNGVVGMVEILSHSRLSEQQADAVATIRESAFSLLGLIDDILDFSKIEAGRLELERARVALPELIESVCQTLVPVALDKDVDLSLFIDPQVPAQVWADATRLRQVLFNLAGNAIKFSAGRPAQRGRVSVRVEIIESSPPSLILRIVDNGIGIAPETLPHLFSAFRQAETSTMRRFGGTGLGLAISNRLVALMHGDIQVHSTLGEGSSFIVALPLERDDGAPAETYPDLTGLGCVIVGSDVDVDDLRVYLEHAGAQVHWVADLATAVKRVGDLGKPVVIHNSPVVIHNKLHDRPTLDELDAAFSATPGIHHLLIARGRRQRARVVGATALTLDGNCLRRFALLRALAVAAGRASPEVVRRSSEADELVRAKEHPLSVAEARAQGRLILVAEDDEINQKVILRQLELLGYAAEVAGNGTEALSLWREGECALLLTDLHMPEMDGYKLAQAIRREEAQRDPAPDARLPILALTANALRGESVRAHAAGMDDYLTKPLELQGLKVALAKWIPQDPDDRIPIKLDEEPSQARTRPVFDVAVLERVVGDDPQIVLEFLADYRASAQALATELDTAWAAKELRQIGAIAHKLKSSSRAIGALLLGDLCAELENTSRTGALEELAEAMTQFDAGWAEADAQIGQFLALE